MANEIAKKNNDVIQNFPERNFSIQEIAQKIIDAENNFSDYLDELECGIPQIAENKKMPLEYEDHHLGFSVTLQNKQMVFKGQKLGDYVELLGSRTRIVQHFENIGATHDGFFIPDLAKFYVTKRGELYSETLPVEFGRLYLPEFPFYKTHKAEIEAEIQRIKDKLQKEQRDILEDIDELLKELDKYVLAKQTIAIETLQEINSDLKILHNQKDNLEDIKSIQNYVSHFETTYMEAIKNQNLTDIIENRMLTVLQTFYEILEPDFDFSENMSESSDFRLKAIKSAGNKIKFEIEFNEKLSTLDEAVTKLQEKFANEKKLDFELLKAIENLSVYFHAQKDKATQKKTLEQSKDILESIWKEYAGQDDKSSSSESNLKRILKNFYLFFGKSEQEIYDFFKKHDEEMDFSRKITEQTATTKQLTSSMRELESIVESHEQMKIEILQNLEDLLNELAKQKDIIQDKSELEKCKNHFDAVFKDFKRRKEASSSSKLRMQEIANRFDEILETKEKKGFFSKLFGK